MGSVGNVLVFIYKNAVIVEIGEKFKKRKECRNIYIPIRIIYIMQCELCFEASSIFNVLNNFVWPTCMLNLTIQ